MTFSLLFEIKASKTKCTSIVRQVPNLLTNFVIAIRYCKRIFFKLL